MHDHKFLVHLLNHPKNWFNNPQNLFSDPKNLHFTYYKIAVDTLWINLSKPVGLVTAFLISLTISVKKHWYWLNSWIVFLLAILLLKYNLFGWNYLHRIFLVPGSIFKEYSIGYFLVNGLIMLAIGLLLLFLKQSMKFIDFKSATTAEDIVS